MLIYFVYHVGQCYSYFQFFHDKIGECLMASSKASYVCFLSGNPSLGRAFCTCTNKDRLIERFRQRMKGLDPRGGHLSGQREKLHLAHFLHNRVHLMQSVWNRPSTRTMASYQIASQMISFRGGGEKACEWSLVDWSNKTQADVCLCLLQSCGYGLYFLVFEMI